LLDQFDLADARSKPFRSYSKGMKRKLTIAAGIIHAPKILFLDEPTTGIDVTSARQIRQLIRSLNQTGTTILLTTHYIEEAERLCHRIAFLVGGKIVRTGTLSQLMDEGQQEKVIQFRLAGPVAQLESAVSREFPQFVTEISGDGIIRIKSQLPVNIMPFMRFFDRNNLDVYEAKIIRPSLEEVFVKVTGLEIAKMKQEKEKSKR
jgi:ABC-2 type transport system ATP-binding protein